MKTNHPDSTCRLLDYRLIGHRFLLMAIAGLLTAAAWAQTQTPSLPLGDVAAQARRNRVRMKNHTSRVVTNDDLEAKAPALKTSSNARDTATSDANSSTGSAERNSSTTLDAQWSARLGALKDAIARMQRSLENAESTLSQRRAEYYSNAGSGMNDPNAYRRASLESDEQLDAFRARLAQARAQLEELKEQARKAGASSKVYQ